MENYEELLSEAYVKVKPITSTERFEIPKIEGHIEGKRDDDRIHQQKKEGPLVFVRRQESLDQLHGYIILHVPSYQIRIVLQKTFNMVFNEHKEISTQIALFADDFNDPAEIVFGQLSARREA